MPVDLIDVIRSLCYLMEQESDALATSGRMASLAETAAAKIRLVGQLDAELARLARATPGWQDTLDEAERREIADAVEHLRDAAAINADVLERQIEFSIELMAAIAEEAQRLSGRRSQTYAASGDLAGIALPSPISINTRL